LALEAERDKAFITTATSDLAVSFQFYFPNLVAPGIIRLFRRAKIISNDGISLLACYFCGGPETAFVKYPGNQVFGRLYFVFGNLSKFTATDFGCSGIVEAIG
jgi:hypothetical protein